MTANDLYPLSVKAYNGDEQARTDWIAAVSPVAVYFGKIYGVLPSLIIGKIITESGWASDCYEKTLEEDFGIEMASKARRHNNILAINGFPDNKKYPKGFPVPAWYSYRSEFIDYGTHYNDAGELIVKIEAWKGYLSIEDCIEDWCANMRYQADRNHRTWTGDIRGQLLAIESYTPEGAASKYPGMHFDWQDDIIDLYIRYQLYKYDKGVKKVEKMTAANLDKNIKKAYEFTHKYCDYGRSDLSYPPGENGFLDCVGLVYRALYTMGHYTHAMNIDQVISLCTGLGMKKSTDINDVWLHHGVVCMQDKNNRGTQHVNHVYYSLGGTSVSDITKYDTGSRERIRSAQPFTHVPVNQWPDKRIFLCVLYLPDDSPVGKPIFIGTTKKALTLRELPGKGNAAVCNVPAKSKVKVYGVVNTSRLNRWYFVSFGEHFGYCYAGSVTHKKYTIPKAYMTVKTPDNSLTCRVGAGVDYPIFKLCPAVKNSAKLRIINRLTASDGTIWYNVYRGGLRFFVSGAWLK